MGISFRTVFIIFSPVLLFCNLGNSPPSKSYLAMEEGIIRYRIEREKLSDGEISEILSKGRSLLGNTEIIHTLIHGGSAIFPHASILKCGDQIAAVAQAALIAAQVSGKKILVLGVLHSLSEEIATGRMREIAGEDVSEYPCRGIFGPGLPNEEVFKREYSIDNFLFLLKHAMRQQNSFPIEVHVRFPNHIFGHPETVLGMEELIQLAQESIVVATGDLMHHGVNYGVSLAKALPINEDTLDIAKQNIQHGLDMLQSNDLLSYRNYCYKTISDAFEIGQTLFTLLGPLKAQIHDIRLVNISDLFPERLEPNWVATSFVELRPLNEKRIAQ